MMRINDIDILPEEYDVEHMKSLPDIITEFSQMAPIERRFINGMVRLLKPRCILELGVAEGAGSAVILNAISDMPHTTLTSFDVAISPGRYPEKKIGFAVNYLPDMLRKKWRFFPKKEFSDYAERFEEKFDLVIIDTAHIHPVETLNFLCVLPYLSNNAVVMFHDLNLFIFEAKDFNKFPMCPFASKIVFDTIVGDKLFPVNTDLKYGMPCLAAVQITSDTKKYIDNVFSMLSFPWADYTYCVLPYLKNITKIIKDNYSEKCFNMFLRAVIGNIIFLENDYIYKETLYDFYNIIRTVKEAKKYIFYGAGRNCLHLLKIFEHKKLSMPNQIWDIEPELKKEINEISVVAPAFKRLHDDEFRHTVIVITIGDKMSSYGLKRKMLEINPNLKVFTYNEICKCMRYIEVEDAIKINTECTK